MISLPRIARDQRSDPDGRSPDVNKELRNAAEDPFMTRRRPMDDLFLRDRKPQNCRFYSSFYDWFFFCRRAPDFMCLFFREGREKGGNLSCVSGGALPFPPAGTTKAGQAKTTFHIVWAGTARVRERKEEKGFPPSPRPWQCDLSIYGSG